MSQIVELGGGGFLQFCTDPVNCTLNIVLRTNKVSAAEAHTVQIQALTRNNDNKISPIPLNDYGTYIQTLLMNKTKDEITLYRFYTTSDQVYSSLLLHLAFPFINHKAVFRHQFQDATQDPSLWSYPELTEDVRKEIADQQNPNYNYQYNQLWDMLPECSEFTQCGIAITVFINIQQQQNAPFYLNFLPEESITDLSLLPNVKTSDTVTKYGPQKIKFYKFSQSSDNILALFQLYGCYDQSLYIQNCQMQICYSNYIWDSLHCSQQNFIYQQFIYPGGAQYYVSVLQPTLYQSSSEMVSFSYKYGDTRSMLSVDKALSFNYQNQTSFYYRYLSNQQVGIRVKQSGLYQYYNLYVKDCFDATICDVPNKYSYDYWYQTSIYQFEQDLTHKTSMHYDGNLIFTLEYDNPDQKYQKLGDFTIEMYNILTPTPVQKPQGTELWLIIIISLSAADLIFIIFLYLAFRKYSKALSQPQENQLIRTELRVN